MDDTSKSVVAAGTTINVPAKLAPIAALLSQIRPEWQARRLVQRVVALLPVDPGSACQRLLNASIRDLKEKLIIAGIDLAIEAAKLHKLPPITKAEDVLENYSTTNTLDLAYRVGLLTRSEWRRLSRAYDIRRDLEHEDDEYEAHYEDCVYVFGSCIEIVLSKDPVELIRIADVKQIIESPNRISLTPDLLDDYERAPDVRQIEIVRMLMGVARSTKQPDIVRQNAVEALRNLQPLTRDKVKITVAEDFQDAQRSRALHPIDMKLAAAIGVVPYLKQRRVAAFFSELTAKLLRVSPDWGAHDTHGEPLSTLEDCGGLSAVPDEQLIAIIRWLVECYLGEKGGYGTWGRNRLVFYSNSAAPIIERLLFKSGPKVLAALEKVASEERIKKLTAYNPIARRLESLMDLAEVPSGS